MCLHRGLYTLCLQSGLCTLYLQWSVHSVCMVVCIHCVYSGLYTLCVWRSVCVFRVVCVHCTQRMTQYLELSCVTTECTKAGVAHMAERQTHKWKLAGLILRMDGGTIFFSPVNFLCWLLFGVCSTPMLPLWHVKDHSHSGGRLHLNAHTPLTQQSWSGLTLLFRQSVETY